MNKKQELWNWRQFALDGWNNVDTELPEDGEVVEVIGKFYHWGECRISTGTFKRNCGWASDVRYVYAWKRESPILKFLKQKYPQKDS